MSRGVFLVVVGLVVAGCYTLHPIPEKLGERGMVVRVELTDGASSNFDVQGGGVIEGEVVTWSADTLELSFVRDRMAISRRVGVRETIALPVGQVETVHRKRFSATRTAGLAAGVGLVAATAATYLFRRWAGGTLRGSPGNGGTETEIAR